MNLMATFKILILTKFWESSMLFFFFFPFNVRLNPVQMSWVTMLNSGLEGEDVVVFKPIMKHQ